MFKIKLPVGARVNNVNVENSSVLIHLGNGEFASEKPVCVVEGDTPMGSPTHGEWPAEIALDYYPTPRGDIARRFALTVPAPSLLAAVRQAIDDPSSELARQFPEEMKYAADHARGAAQPPP